MGWVWSGVGWGGVRCGGSVADFAGGGGGGDKARRLLGLLG